jgi:retron-type reverse transcriptase
MEAEQLKEALTKRLEECKLELHPDKTKIVYCKDDKRRGEYENISFAPQGQVSRTF